ncbi:hypothetical protein SAMN05216338_1003302 [Bradyrhizobium sp. Rc2d]|uniref:hypothetical protein n=1 Tax=Bradyrhizobium sp. Rc2d TaxID=1855321 RepID=UPI00088D72E9|nr:hypothetical protein [Bradyrhizobium sp. Rc2d]SDG87980.1 hypothetical protein SAMN05216338_1003302 [Bradyrhizobium sp. Rc2d]
MAEVKITANQSDEESWRIERLEEVRDIILEKGVKNILALHDHKGNLYVDWSEQPSTYALATAIKIWSDKGEPHSNHSVRGRPLVWDMGGDNPFCGPSFP